MERNFAELDLNIVFLAELDLQGQQIIAQVYIENISTQPIAVQKLPIRMQFPPGIFFREKNDIPLALFGSLTAPVLRCLEGVGVTSVQHLEELSREQINELGIGFVVNPIIEFFSQKTIEPEVCAKESQFLEIEIPETAQAVPEEVEREETLPPAVPALSPEEVNVEMPKEPEEELVPEEHIPQLPIQEDQKPTEETKKLPRNATLIEVEEAVSKLPAHNNRMTVEDFVKIRESKRTKNFKTLGDLLKKPRIFYEGFLGIRTAANLSWTVRQLGYELPFAKKSQKRLKIDDPRVREYTLLGEFLKILHPKDGSLPPQFNGKINREDVDACSEKGIHTIEDVTGYTPGELSKIVSPNTAKRLSSSLRVYRFYLKKNELNRPEIKDGSILLKDLKPYLPFLRIKYRLQPVDVDKVFTTFGEETTLGGLLQKSYTQLAGIFGMHVATKISKTVQNLMRKNLIPHQSQKPQ